MVATNIRAKPRKEIAKDENLLRQQSNEKQLSLETISIAYDRTFNRLYQNALPIHMFGTGSEGNAVYIKPYRTLIDLGLNSYKKYMDYDPYFFMQVDNIILTHAHSDHLNPSALKKVLTNYPHIRVYMHSFMWQHITSRFYKPKYKRITTIPLFKLKYDKHQLLSKGYDIDENGEKIIEDSPWKPIFEQFKERIFFIDAKTQYNLTIRDRNDVWLYPLTTKHGDLLNIAIRLYDTTSNIRWFYASDLDTLEPHSIMFTDLFGNDQIATGLSGDDWYDCMLLEANYDEKILHQCLEDLANEYVDAQGNVTDPVYYKLKYRPESNLRHISEQKAFDYVQKHLVPNGIFIPLHASKSYGTLWQDTNN